MAERVSPYHHSLIKYLHLKSSEISDFTIFSDEQHEFRCNRLLLAARSKYFEALFRQEPDKSWSKLNVPKHLLRVLLDSLVTPKFWDCDLEELLQLMLLVDFLQMPDTMEEIEKVLVGKLNLDSIYHIMSSLEQFIPTLGILKEKVGLFVVGNILSLDLTQISEEWINASISQPLTNVRVKDGRYLPIEESELKIAEVLFDRDPDKEWNFGQDSRARIASWLHGMENIIRKGGQERPTNTSDFDTIFNDETKTRLLMSKYPSVGMHPDMSLKLVTSAEYGTADDRARGARSRHAGEGVAWGGSGIIRKVFVKDGIWDGRNVVRWVKFLTDQGTIFGTDPPEDSSDEKLAHLNRTTTVLEVPENQHISHVILRSGFYIDQIGFVTNEGVLLGPVGGTGGREREGTRDLSTTQRQLYLWGVEGHTFMDGGSPLNAHMKFHYALISQECRKKNRSNVSDLLELSDSSNWDSF